MVKDLQKQKQTQLQTDDLLYDMVFKHIFLDHPDILISLIKDAIGYDFNPKKVERMVKYLNRLYDRSHIIQNLFGIKDDENLKFIQVHLNTGTGKSGKIITKYNLRADDNRDDILIKNYEIYVINVDNSYKMIENEWKKRYNECSKGLLLVSVFHSNSVKEIEELMIKGGLKKDMAKTLTDTIDSKLNSDEFLDMLFEVRDYEKERQEALEYKLEQGFEQGHEKGLEQGIEQGRELGIEQGLEQGIEKGRELGIEQGIEQGIEKGIEQGREEGRKESTQNIINKLINKGFSDNEISNLLDINHKQLNKLKRVA